jgi:hypothetical protein
LIFQSYHSELPDNCLPKLDSRRKAAQTLKDLKLAHFLLISFALYGGVAAPRVVKTIDRDWTFQYFPSPDPDTAPAKAGFDDSRWQAIALPHTWSTYETTGDLHPFIRSANEREGTYWWYGWGWYRKRFSIGRQYAGCLVSLEFDGAQKYSRIYLNGALVGEHRSDLARRTCSPSRFRTAAMTRSAASRR